MDLLKFDYTKLAAAHGQVVYGDGHWLRAKQLARLEPFNWQAIF